MSDHDAGPDPMDRAYAQADALLSDEAARSARRARVLAAVAREPAPAEASPPIRSSAWRPGRWLVAASVAGLGVFLATQVYTPILNPPRIAQTPPAAPAPAAPKVAASRAPAAKAQTPEPAPRAAAVAPPAAKPSPRDLPAVATPPPALPQVVQAPMPPPAPAARAPAAETQDLVVTAEKRAAVPAASFAARSSAAPPPDPAARLRAAAAAGQAAEVETLLARGVPVDAPDAEGETALMKAVRADHPASAALLRRGGASLERKNHAGVSARDMAASIGDAELDRALGIGP